MALITTTLVPVIQTFPWSGGGGNISPVPRGELIASIQSGAVAATGAGDDAQVNVAIDLPVNRSYFMTDFSATVQTDGANTWELGIDLVYVDAGDAAQRRMRYGFSCEALRPVFDGDFESLIYQCTFPLPKFQMMPLIGGADGSTVQMRFRNVNLQEIAATIDLTARFLIFTVDQRYNVEVNYPQLVR